MNTSPRDEFELRRAVPEAPPAPDTPAAVAGARQWRVRRALPVLKAVAAALFLAAGLISAPDPVGLAIGLAGAVVLTALVVRDLVAGVRLSADASGVTVVTGYAGHRHLPWSAIERIRVDRRSRLGVRAELVEVDCGDDLYLFGATELGAPCEEVVAQLTALRPTS